MQTSINIFAFVATSALVAACGGKSSNGSSDPDPVPVAATEVQSLEQPDVVSPGSGGAVQVVAAIPVPDGVSEPPPAVEPAISPAGPSPPGEPEPTANLTPPPVPAPSPQPQARRLRLFHQRGFVSLSFEENVPSSEGYRAWSLGIAPSRVANQKILSVGIVSSIRQGD